MKDFSCCHGNMGLILPLDLVADGNPEVWETINLQQARISRAWLPP